MEENSYEDNRANSYLQQRDESRLKVEFGSGFDLGTWTLYGVQYACFRTWHRHVWVEFIKLHPSELLQIQNTIL